MKIKERFLQDIIGDDKDILSLMQKYHAEKFANVDVEKQERKLYEEMAEFQGAITEEEKIDEACDVIISAIGFIDRLGKKVYPELMKKFCKVLDRDYPDNFQHREGKDD